MTTIESISSRLDSLLSETDDKNCSENNEGNLNNQIDNVEEEIRDYLSLLSKRTSLHQNSEPLFPSDFSGTGKSVSKGNSQDKTLLESENKKMPVKKKSKEKIASVKSETNFRSNTDLAVKTVAELSKKVRDLNAQLTATQNKLRAAQGRILQLEEMQPKQVVKPKVEEELSENQISLYEKQIKELNEKLTSSNAKLCETRNQLQQQKHEVKVLQKAISSEIGENVSLENITREGWRGRAQQIISLQNKVCELSERLSQTSIPLEERTISTIQQLEKTQDKEKIELLSQELVDAKSLIDELKNKNDQSKARIKVLTTEINAFKDKYESQNTQNEENVKQINTLTARLMNISQKFQERERNLAEQYEGKLDALHIQYKEEKLKAEQLKKIVIDRDTKIEKLEVQIKQLHQMQKEKEERPPSSWSAFHQRPPSQHSGSTECLPSTEVERMRLMELVTVLNRRLEEERKRLDNLQEELRQERHRSGRLETRCSRLEMEKVGKGLSYKRSSSSLRSNESTISKAELNAAKDRCELLEEKILALQSRVERMRKEKEEETRIYLRMVEEARQAARDVMRKTNISSNNSLP